MSDITLLYYTANRIGARFAGAVRRLLVENTAAPIVVVSQRGTPHGDLEISADFANRIAAFRNVGDVPPSIYQVYRNVLVGAQLAETPFVAMAEDDTVYAPSHWKHRPAGDIFAYDCNRAVITRRLADDGKSRTAFYYFRERTQMAMLVCSRDLLIETLTERFAAYPYPPASHEIAKKSGWGEPGRYEKNLKLTLRQRTYFGSPEPSVTFNHACSLMGRRKVNPGDRICQTIPVWGDADVLWRRIHG